MDFKLKKPKKVVDQIVDTSKSPIKKRMNIDPRYLIPTGSTLLNLACSDNHLGGYGLGRVVNIIGDSHTGKSILALSSLADASLNPKFDKYKLYYDDVEAAFGFDLKYLFNEKIAKRIDYTYQSNMVEDFYGHIIKLIKIGDPFIYILDSLDALTSAEEIKRASKYIDFKLDEKKKQKGSFKLEKPKLVSEILRVVAKDIRQIEACVIVVSQTRDRIDAGPFQSKKDRAGGKALQFYASHIMWLAIIKRFASMKREIGIHTQSKISKNKLTGKSRIVQFPIYYDYGVDDIRSCVDFLVEEGHWKKTKQTIKAHDFSLEGERATIIKGIEQNNLEKEVKKLTGELWNEIEDSIRLDRKPKY